MANVGQLVNLNLADLDGSNGFVLNGIPEFGATGESVSGAGDFNGDGFDDLIIGAPFADPNGNASGQSYVVFGSDEGFPTILKLADLDGSNGFALNGITSGDTAGSSVSGAGDVNGDGCDDLIIGAPAVDSDIGDSYVGQSYVVFGSNGGFSAAIELAELDGFNGFALNGIGDFDTSGSSVSGAGDINGDGFDDLIVGASYGYGQVHVVFGSDEGFPTILELADLDGVNGFTLNGINGYDATGSSVSGAGDINGDGFDDLIVGAPSADPNGSFSGQSYVVFGSDEGFLAVQELADLDGSDGFTLNGIAAGDFSGTSVSGAGDINSDGFDDFIVGARGADPNGSSSGQSYVVFGSDEGFPAILELADLDGSNGFALNGIAAFGSSGASVSGAGDINGDGFDDLIIGAPNADSSGYSNPFSDGPGQSYVIFGSDEGFPSVLELSDLDGINGLNLNGISEGDSSGESVSGVGDINGDGFNDLIVGAPDADPSGYGNPFSGGPGQSYVIFDFSTDADVDDDGIAEVGILNTDIIETGPNTDAFVGEGETGVLNSGTFSTGAGDDSISGIGVEDGILNSEEGLIDTGVGSDTVSGTSSEDDGIDNAGEILTGTGTDSILGEGEDDGIDNIGLLSTGSGDDLISGISNSILGGTNGIFNSGEINTGVGNDFIDGVGGSNGIFNGIFGSITTGAGTDVITGQSEGDGIENAGIIATGAGNDIVIGTGSDAFSGFAGGGTIDLGVGADVINGFGEQTVFGGTGFDTAVFEFATTDVDVFSIGTTDGIDLEITVDLQTMSFGSVEAFMFADGTFTLAELVA